MRDQSFGERAGATSGRALLVLVALGMACSRWQSGAAGSLSDSFETRVSAVGTELVLLARGHDRGHEPRGSALFRSSDGGVTWRRWRVDGEVEALAGRGEHWALLVHGWAVLESHDGGRTFRRLPLPVHEEPAYYGIRVEPDDALTVWGRDWIYRDGELVGRLPDAAAGAPFPHDQLIAEVVEDGLVLVSPFLVYRLAPILEPFSEGLAPAPEREFGIVMLATIDGAWIADSHDGIYIRRPDDATWRKLSGETSEDALAQRGSFATHSQRGLVASPFEPGTWIAADDEGLHAATPSGVARVLWRQPPGFEVGLISGLATTPEVVAAGFYRARSDAAGVVLRKDGTATVIELPER